ncbi:hypothetical protein ACOMHN_042954 [Nucella lapillus]
MSEVTSSVINVTTTTTTTTSLSGVIVPRWQYASYVTVVTTVVTLSVCVVGLVLNMVLVMTIKYSPSLKTPPNSHLVNICFNNLLLGFQAFLSIPGLYLHGTHELQKRRSEVLSGIQLFLVMHCLLQYWRAFASIGYYRFKTLHRPSLSLRMRKVIVSRSITTIWVISLLLAMTFSLTSTKDSAYLPCTLDSFRKSFYVRVPVPGHKEGSEEDVGSTSAVRQNKEQMVVLSLVVSVLLVGLCYVLLSYYSICRTLSLAPRLGKSRVYPWPRQSTSSLTPPCYEVVVGPAASSVAESTVVESTVADNGLDSAAGGGRAYRADAGESALFGVSGPQITDQRGDSAVWKVHYHKYDHNVAIPDIISLDKSRPPPMHRQSRSASVKRDMYANKRPLTSNLSTGSTTSSGKVSSTKCPDFSDISLGADFARRQKQQNHSALKKQSVRRERGSLSNASKNSLVMLTAYLLFSLPLIVCQVGHHSAR